MSKLLIIATFIISIVLLQPSIKKYNLSRAEANRQAQIVTVKEAARVWAKLVNVLPSHARVFNFKLIKSDDINAYADSNFNVLLTTGMLRFVKSEDELAMFLGHEIAHHLLAHTSGLGVVARVFTARFVNSPHFEAMSDMLGAHLARLAGYNTCAGIDSWKRMRSLYGNDVIAGESHPNIGARIYQFEQSCSAP